MADSKLRDLSTDFAVKAIKICDVMNSAFAVSASLVFGSHLAFTVAYDGTYVTPMIVGKLFSGICAVILAGLICKGDKQEEN